MRNFFLNILKNILKRLARAMLWRYKPGIIAITGSAGKTSVKEAVNTVLSFDRRVRSASGNLNNELGLPLAVLGDYAGAGGNPFFWLGVVIRSCFSLLIPTKYPEILVLEYAVDRPGDMDHLLSIASPNIAVVTALGDVPVHVEFFSSPEAVGREKAKLLKTLPSVGFAILNTDDPAVAQMAGDTRAHVMSYGFGEGTEMKITSLENWTENGVPSGLSFKLEHAGSVVPVRLRGAFGKPQAYAAAAAACAGLIFGFNLVKISEALERYHPPKGRMRLLKGVKDTLILDDTYNASPVSMRAALDTLRDLKARRKIAVLGDMLEIGRYTPEAHEAAGRIAKIVADVLVTVGLRARFIAKAAEEIGMPPKNIRSFDTADAAGKAVEEIMRKGDLVLVKGSQGMRMEKIVREIMAEPNRARELLVRQSSSWLKK